MEVSCSYRSCGGIKLCETKKSCWFSISIMLLVTSVSSKAITFKNYVCVYFRKIFGLFVAKKIMAVRRHSGLLPSNN